MKYVVVVEIENGYMECVSVCDTPGEAFGAAYLAITEGLKSDAYYVTIPEPREGENGDIISVVDRETGKEQISATILKYKGDEEEALPFV